MVTILTALRGNPALSSRWLRAAANCGIESRIIAAVNNDADEQAVVAVDGAVAIPVILCRSDEHETRINHIADIYQELVTAAETDLVLLWDDDILPPYKGAARLLAAMQEAKPDVAGIVSVYPFNPDDFGQACLFKRATDQMAVMRDEVPATGMMEVWGGGCGFSLWRREALLATLPWRSNTSGGCIEGWDQDLARKLHAAKLRTLCECSVRCRHDNLPR